MYEYEKYAKEVACQQNQIGLIGGAQIDRNPTVVENIDAKIAMLLKEIERLEESKKTLAPLLGMRIRDIQEAMRF